VRDGLITVEKWHVAQIDFPIQMARSARIIGVKRRPALRKCGQTCTKEKNKTREWMQAQTQAQKS
jgi:hypothetical protein